MIGIVAVAALTFTGAAGATGTLQWSDDGNSFTTFGANASITISMGTIDYACDSLGVHAADIYIVPSGAAAMGSALHDVNGAPNVIQTAASGGLFIGETIGYTAPTGSIGPGTYAVVYDECQNGKVDPGDLVVDPAFTVNVPTDVPPLPGGLTALKANAKEQGDKNKGAAKKLAALFAAYEIWNAVSDFIDATTGTLLVNLYINYLCNYITPSIDGSPITPWCPTVSLEDRLRLEVATIKLEIDASRHWYGINADPPDPNFRDVPQLGAFDPTVPASESPADQAVAALEGHQKVATAASEQLLHALERYQGAAGGSDGVAALMQARQIQSYAGLLASELRASNPLIDDMLASIGSSGRDVSTLQTKLASLQQRLRSSGVTADERRQLRNLGLSDADIAAATTRVGSADFTTIDPGGTLQSSLDAMKAQNTATAATLDALKSDMDAIVSSLVGQGFNVTPTITAEGPFNGLVGQSISLDSDAAIATTETLTVSWDLNGDGVFDDATGTAPTYTWTAPYDGPVGVKVVSASGRSAVAYSHATIRATNHLPLFGLSTPHDGALTQLLDGASQTFIPITTDADGDPVTLNWTLDSVPAGSAPSFTYTAAGAGPHTIQVTASDGHGTTVGPTWTVFAEQPDADSDGYNANADCNDTNPAVNPGHREVIGNGIDDDCNADTPDTGSAPTAAFTTGAPPAAVGVPFQFTDVSTDPDDDIVSWQWSFGDLSLFATTRNPLHTFTTPGTYTVELSVTDAQGHTSLSSSSISVDTAPVASFSYTPSLLDVVTAASFTDTSSDPDAGDSIVSRSWAFGDGATSTDAAPVHTYIFPGLYLVSLTVTDSHGLTDTQSQVVSVDNIPNPPNAAFTYTPTAPAQEEPVQFTDASTDAGGIVSAWAWDFGDGTTSAQQNPVHAFSALGAHVVKLTITDSRGAKTAASQTVTVSAAQPLAAFTSSSSSNVALAEDGASIVSVSSEYSSGYPASTFIDADPSNSYWATASGTSTATVVIRLAGTRTWRIDKVFLRPNSTCCFGERVRDFAVDVSTDGSTYTNVLNATAADTGELQEFDLAAPVQARYVRYRGLDNRGSGCCVSQQQFKVSTFERGSATTSFVNGSRNADSYLWDFGDGTTSTDASPSHHFATSGTQHVTLTATKGASSSVATMDYDVVGPVGSFATTPIAPEVGSPVTFTDTSVSTGSITSRNWSFGDGTSSSAASPIHTYTAAATYHVTLTVTDGAGRQDTVSRDVVASPASGTNARFTPRSGDGNVGAATAGATIDSFSSQYSSSYSPDLMLLATAGSYYWASGGGIYDAWAKLKLPGSQPYLVDGVAVRPVVCCPDQRVTRAQIAVSPATSADADFTTILDTPIADGSSFQDFSFAPVPAAFVRYTAHNGHPSCCVSTQQVRVYSPQFGGPHVSFRNDSTNATSYAWDFGDGSSSADAEPSHTYAAPGTYAVTLTATGPSGTSTYSLPYTYGGPTAGFSYAPLGAAPNTPIAFADSSTPLGSAAIGSWRWDFGDGTTSTLKSPTHIFASNGTFTVSLRVRDDNGWGDVATRSVTVGTGIPGPAAFFAPYPANGGRNIALYDTGARVTRSSGNYPGCCEPDQMLKAAPQNWWATPPGQTTNGFAVVDLAGTLTGSWLINRIEVGSDGICCSDQRVRDFAVDAGLVDTDSAFVPVVSGTADTSTGAVRSLSLERPVRASFLRYRPLNDVAAYCCISTRQFRAFTGQEGGREVTFKNFTTGASSYSWDFGDPSSGARNASTEASPTHVFGAPGTYHVTMVADDGAGHTDTVSVDQVVLPEPVVTVTGPSVGFRGRTSTFTSKILVPAGVSVLSTTWNYGDGATSSGSRGDHAYAADGVYTVKFEVVDSNGQTTTATKTLTVTAAAPPGSGFTTATSWVTGIPSTCCNVGPVGMAWDPSGRMIVSDLYSGYLYRFGGEGGVADDAHRLNSTPLPGALLGLAFDRAGHLYATRSSYGDVVEIDQSNWTIQRVVATGIGCTAGIAVDPLSGDLFVGDCSGLLRLTGFSTGTATVTRYAGVGSLRQFTFAPDGTIYGTQWYTNVLRIEGTGSASPGAVSTVYSDLREVDGIALGPGTGLPGAPPVIYVNRNDGQITKLDFGIFPLAATTIFAGGTRGAYMSVGPDSCLYATQTTSIVKLTYANGDCTLTQPAEPRLALSAPLSTPSQHIGGRALFVATVSNTATLGGVTVKFEVTGANTATYQATSDSQGRASIELVGVNAGTDTVVASAKVGSTSFSSNSETATWTTGSGAPVASFVPRPVGGGRNVGLKEGGATIAAFSSKYNDDHSPEAMIDYSTNEYYESPGGLPWATAYGTGFDTSQFAVVKLPGSFLVDKVYVMPRKCCDGQRVRDFEIAYSNSPTYDPSSFVTVLRASAENLGRLQEFALPQAVRATFIRYSPIDNYGDGCCIATMQLQVISGQQGGADVHFENTTLDATSYHWDFGDGTSSTERNPTHHYTAPGAYPVTMTATNPSGSSTITVVQRVFAPPTASIAGPAQTHRNAAQTFVADATGSSGSSIAEYRWDWGDGQVSLGKTVAHQWATDGTYTITLRVADANDQSTKITRQIVVAPAAATGYAYTKWATDIPSGCCDIGPVGVAFDPQGRLWVADPYYNGGALYRFGPDGGAAGGAFVGSLSGAPHGLAFGKDGRLYVARRGYSDVAEVNPATGAPIRIVASGIGCPTGLATDPVSGDLFVTTTGCEATTIWRIVDPGGATPTKTPYVSNAGNADGITFAPDGTIYVEINSQIVRVGGTNVPGKGQLQFLLGLNQMDGIAVQPSTLPGEDPTLFVNRNDGLITRVDLSQSPPSVTDIVRGGTRGDFIAVGPDGCLYATQTSSILRVTNADGSCVMAPTSAVPQLRLRPAPSNPTPTTGAVERFTASVANASGAGVPVTFTVTGANPGTLVATTDASGSATIEYTGSAVGTDTITATATVDGQALSSNHSSVTWTQTAAGPPIALFDPATRGSGRNVAAAEAGATATQSDVYNSDYNAQSMLDSNVAEYYEPNNGLGWITQYGHVSDPHWARIVLAPGSTGGNAYMLDRIRILGRRCCPSQGVRTFEVAVSTTTQDDSAFTTILHAVLDQNDKLQEFILPSPMLAKYIRYTPIDNYGDGCCIATMAFKAVTGQSGGSVVSFRNMSSNAISYEWDFGDGTSHDSSKNPTHTYSAPGTYHVTLTATNANGSATYSLDQEVIAGPDAAFTWAPDPVKEGVSTTFTPTVTPAAGTTITRYAWNWGDGTTSTGPSPAHTFVDNGTYDVSLETVDSRDQKSFTHRTVTVLNQPPTITLGPDWNWRAGRSWTDTAATVTDPGAKDSIVSCSWDFGDGTTSACPSGFGPLAHTYAADGTYTVAVTATDNDGGSATATMKVNVVPPKSSSGGSSGGGGSGGVNVGTDVTYTRDADFEHASLLNVNHDVPNGDQLQLNEKAKPLPFVAIPGTNRGTMIRININTGKIVGEYWSSPAGRARNPSRTTIDQRGNTWMTNRDEGDYVPSTGRYMGSIERVGVILGGSRANADGTPNPDGEYLAPPYEYNTCVDRNGDGLIHTSNGYGDVLPWTNDAGADNSGGVSTAADECLITYTRTFGTNARTVAIDKHNNLWVGGLGNQWHEEIDGVTGLHVAGTEFNLGCGGYGGFIDSHGVLWSARGGSGLMRYDTNTRSGYCIGNGQGDYGLGLDPKTGEVWHTYLGAGALGQVVKMDKDGNVLGRYEHGFPNAQGVAVDASGNVWVAHSLFGSPNVGHLKTDGTFIGNVSLLGETGPTGVAVDANGKVWTANNNSSSASRIDPDIGPIVHGFPTGYTDLTVRFDGGCYPNVGCLSGAYPYSYSDMTGFVSIGSTAPQGTWDAVQDGGASGTQWGTIDWNHEAAALVPAGSSVEVSARAADSLAGLSSSPFVPVSNGVAFSLTGRYLEVQVTLRANSDGQSPVVSDLRVRAAGLNHPPSAAGSAFTTTRNTSHDVTLQATDADGDPLSYSIVAPPSHGTLIGAAPNLTYLPDPSYAGPDSFTFIANDGHGDSNVGTVSIQVTSPPVALAAATPNPAAPGQLIAFDGSGSSDPDPARTIASWSWDFGGGSTATGPTATHAFALPGDYPVTLTVADNGLPVQTDSTTIVVHVVDRAPVGAGDDYSVHAGRVLHVAAPGPLANDSDPDGDSLAVVSGTQPLHGTYVLSAAGELTYTPAAGFAGTDSFTYVISDGALSSAPATITVHVTNGVPVGVPESYSVHFGQTLHVAAPGVLGNDVDPEGDPLTASSMPQHPQHGQAALANTGELIYVPDAGFVGDDSFTYTPNDGFADGAPVTVTIHVTDAAPTPAPDLYTTLQDQALTIDNPGVLANDTDPDGDPLTRSLLVAQATHGQVLLAFAGGFSYTPSPGFHGVDSFTYTVGDGGRESAPVTVTIVVDGAPVASADDFSIHHGAALDIPYASLTANDTDPEGEPLFVVTSSATGAAHGTIAIGATGFTYSPERGFVGDDSFTYRVTDGRAQSAPATVTVHVTDAAPVARDDVYSVHAGQVLHVSVPGPLGNDSDPDGDPLAVVSGTQPSHGTYVLSAAGELTYTPAAGFAGTDSFTYIVSDGALSSQPATITVHVTNGVPVGAPESYSVHFGQTLHVAAPGVLGNDTDPEGDPLTASSMPQHPQHGQAALANTGELIYVPDAGFVGDDSFTYTPGDGFANGPPVTVTLHVTDAAPVAGPDSATVLQGDSVSGNVLANDSDPDGDPLSVALFSGPAHGTVSLAPGGGFTYASAPGFFGVETFTYLLSDGGLSVPGTVTIDVQPRNHPPVVSLAPAGPVNEGTSLPLTASGSDPDPGQTLTYTWTVTPNASLVPAGATASFFADDGPTTALVTVRACDDGAPAYCAVASQPIDVRNVAPTVNAAATPSPQYWGLPVHFAGAATDPSKADTLVGFTYQWSLGDLLSPASELDRSYALPGSYAATFSATDKDGGLGSKTVSVSITKRPTSIVFTAPLSQPFGPTQLSARLVDGASPATALLAGRLLTFAAGGRTFTATTDATGSATVAPPPFLLSGPVTVSFAGNALYTPSATTVQLAITNAFGNGPGFFTLGDRTVTSGTVSWWTSQWEKTNVLSGGAAPSAFKGFVDAPSLTGCGGTWTTAPGNSSGPPASVGPYLAVIVASRITKSGSTISGSVVHILAVKTAPGYGPSPGHDGTGQVVGTVC